MSFQAHFCSNRPKTIVWSIRIEIEILPWMVQSFQIFTRNILGSVAKSWAYAFRTQHLSLEAQLGACVGASRKKHWWALIPLLRDTMGPSKWIFTFTSILWHFVSSDTWTGWAPPVTTLTYFWGWIPSSQPSLLVWTSALTSVPSNCAVPVSLLVTRACLPTAAPEPEPLRTQVNWMPRRFLIFFLPAGTLPLPLNIFYFPSW